MNHLLHNSSASALAGSSATFGAWAFALCAASVIANAQFKEIGPAPFPAETVARQKIREKLEKVDPSNRQETVKTLTGWLDWYRDLLDEELIAAWQRDTRANLTEVMGPLADPRVASAVVEFSWRQRRQAGLNLAYAPMLVDLMERFAESAKPFRDDLLGPAATGQEMPALSQSEAEAVCRILIDMPDLRTWRKDALQILPHYRRVAESLLVQQMHGSDQEKSYQAQVWLRELKSDVPDVDSERPSPRDPPRPILSRTPAGNRTPPVTAGPDASFDTTPAAPAPAKPAPTPAPLPAPQQVPLAYEGATGPGTLPECTGGPIPQRHKENTFSAICRL